MHDERRRHHWLADDVDELRRTQRRWRYAVARITGKDAGEERDLGVSADEAVYLEAEWRRLIDDFVSAEWREQIEAELKAIWAEKLQHVFENTRVSDAGLGHELGARMSEALAVGRREHPFQARDRTAQLGYETLGEALAVADQLAALSGAASGA